MQKEPGKIKKWVKGFLKDVWQVFTETAGAILAGL